MSNRKLSQELDLWRIDSDINGNPRYVIHFIAVPFRDKLPEESHLAFYNAHQRHAAKALYVKKYRAKWFGGGVVFSTYTLKDTLRRAGVTVPDDLNGWM